MSESDRDLQHAQEMKTLQQERRAERATKTLRGGLLVVLTGPGKGKSSSAFGMVARALGWDMRVGIVQFIKGKWQTGEKHFFRRFPEAVTFEVMGEGFTWDVQDRQRDIAAARQAWRRSCEMILDPQFDFVLLDELNIALRNDYLELMDDVDARLVAEQAVEFTTFLNRLVKVRDIVMRMNQEYIRSAGQDNAHRTEPPFLLQGSYRNMNKLAERIVTSRTAEIEMMLGMLTS